MIEDVIHQLDFIPLIDWRVIFILAGLAATLCAISLALKGRGILYRGLLYVLGLMLLANPQWIEEKRNPLDDIVAIIVDETGSQTVNDRKTVSEAALKKLQAALARQKYLETRIVRIKNNLGDTEAPTEGSALYTARQELLKDVPANRIAATFMITDGLIHDIPGLSELRDDQGPVHGLLSGRQSEFDRVLSVIEAPGFGIVNKDAKIMVKIEDQGRATGKGESTVNLTVRKDNGAPKRFLVETGKETELLIKLTHGGNNLVTIEVDGLEGELATRNNVAHMVINGVRDRLKVLLVSGEPHMGERSWRNILKSDPSVDLVHFTILRPPEKFNNTPIKELSLIPFPINELFETKLNEFDLIIFDRYKRRGVLHGRYLRNIANYVENGGAFLEAAGPSFATALSLYRTPLATILPGRPTGNVLMQGYHPTVSELGQKHPVTAPLHPSGQQSPGWGRWFRLIDSRAERGNILMTGAEDKPLLILERHFDGRVAQLMSDHSWLWSRGFEGGGPQAELMRRLAHWLMKEPELEEERLGAEISDRTMTIIRRSLTGGHKSVEIRAPSGEVTTTALESKGGGEFHGSIQIDQGGLYMLSEGGISAPVAVGSLNPLEFSQLRSTNAQLQKLQQVTSGGNIWLNESGFPTLRRTSAENRQSGTDWLGIRRNNQYQVTGYQQTRLLSPMAALLMALGLLALAWWRESR